MPNLEKSAPKHASPPATSDPMFGRLLHGLLFISGGLALVYEVLWLRRFMAVFGATTTATAATLAAVFIGLTAGSMWIGHRAESIQRPLRAYGLLEIGAGLACLLVEPILMAYDYFYPSLYARFHVSPFFFGAVKWCLTAAGLFAPTFFMGGTIPMAVQALSAAGARVGVIGSGLYAANTLGAACGALSVSLFWLPVFGARASYLICVALSVMVGAAAWMLDARGRRPVAFASEKKEPNRDRLKIDSAESLPAWSLAALAVLSGALMFVLQVAWTRMFAQVHENSIHSFAVVVAVFILGLAGGAALTRAVLRRGGKPRRFLGRAWILGGVAVFVSPHLFYFLTDGLAYLPQQGRWMNYGLRLVGLAMATLFVPTLLSGTVLPLLMELAGHTDRKPVGNIMGWLLAANTAGVVAGSLLAAFVLPGGLGLWSTIAAVGIVMMLAGEFCLNEFPRVKLRRLATCGTIIAGLFYGNPAKLPRTKIFTNRGESLIELQEGNHGIVAVTERSGSRRLKLDNFYMLGGTASTGDERMQAHIPLLLHPAPRRVAFLGLGTGITAGTALLHPVERVTAIEIVPEVVSAAKTRFKDMNLGVVDSPKAEVVVEDARDFLRGSGRKFDVIAGDLVVPWRRGEAALFSAEHFATVRRALAPGGIFCQWLPMFQLSEEEFRIVVATFLDVFPRATLWRGDFAPDAPALALIGHADDAALIDPSGVARRVRELKHDDSNPHLAHEAGLWIFLVGAIDPNDPQFASAKRNRESHPWLEILAPLAHSASAQGKRPVFVGRPLEHWLKEHRARKLAGSPLETLATKELSWREAGGQLAEASLLLAEGRHAEADTKLSSAAGSLPPEIRRAFVREAPMPDGAR